MAHRIGIIGLGVMGERMLRQMTQHWSFAVVSAWDPAEDAAARLAAIAATARFARDAADLAGDTSVDCVCIATPPASHLADADLAFDRGKPVLCEKPLAVDLAAARLSLARVGRLPAEAGAAETAIAARIA